MARWAKHACASKSKMAHLWSVSMISEGFTSYVSNCGVVTLGWCLSPADGLKKCKRCSRGNK